MPLGCTVHHLPCTAQPRGHTEMGQVFAFAHVRRWNIAQVRMSHQRQGYLRNDFIVEYFKGRYLSEFSA